MPDNDRLDHRGLEKDEQVLDALYQPIFADAHRLESYTGNCTRLLEIFASKGHTQFPQLRSLTVANNFVGFREDVVSKTPIYAPLLQELTLSDFYFPPRPHNIFSEFPWRRITHLTLRELLLDDFDDVKALFKYCPNLEHLIIDKGRFSVPPSWRPRPHLAANLQSLTVIKCTTDFLLPFISAIRAPRLTSLHLNTKDKCSHGIEDERERNQLGLRYFQTLCELLESVDDRTSLKTFMFYGAQDVYRTPDFRLVELVKPLQGLQTLVLDDITPELTEHLTWESDNSSGNANLDHRSLPDLQLLTCVDHGIKNEQRDKRISIVLRSRALPLKGQRKFSTRTKGQVPSDLDVYQVSLILLYSALSLFWMC